MKFHPLVTDTELPKKFTYPFCYTPHPLCIKAAEELKKHITSDVALCSVAEQGKMFGVLVVKDRQENVGFLAAYSGTTCFDFDNSYFVPPVFDYLQEDGFFKIGEREISEINRRIIEIENSDRLKTLAEQLDRLKAEAACKIESYRRKIEHAKAVRDEKRSLACSEEDLEKLRNESRFMKAELKRLKVQKETEINDKSNSVKEITDALSELKAMRKQKSDALQEKLFRAFEMLDKDGNKKDVIDIFKDYGQGIPPAGTGECCAPKMIQYAYIMGYTLVAMAEFWYGKTPSAEIRHHLNYYPSCLGKCKPLLTYMLRGIDMDANPMEHVVENTLEKVYDDEYICVINKPSGMPSVDGKVNTRSAESIVKEMYPYCDIRAVHRLDMDTSGLLVFAKDYETYVSMQKMFAERKVKKRYIAILEGTVEKENGRISLPLSPDYINRPMQMVDKENGKDAVTSYRVVEVKDGRTRISLVPITGRTHQLRVHCAHAEGIGIPIVGDNLYGTADQRLMLHASNIEFVHPVTGHRITLKNSPEF